MVVYGERRRCPRCGQETLERETWVSTRELRAECSHCGYFYEETLGIHTSEEELQAMHFRTDVCPYVREGIIRKTEASGGAYHIANTWFSSPSHCEGLEVAWRDWEKKEDRIEPWDIIECVRALQRLSMDSRSLQEEAEWMVGAISRAHQQAEETVRTCLREIQDLLNSLELRPGMRLDAEAVTALDGGAAPEERQMQCVAKLKRRVEHLELSVRTYNCLRNANIDTVGQLVQKTADELRQVRNFGRKSLREIQELLTGLDLQLEMGLDAETLAALADADALKRMPLLAKLRLRIEGLDMSVRTAQLLCDAQIRTIGDLVQCSKDELLHTVRHFVTQDLYYELGRIQTDIASLLEALQRKLAAIESPEESARDPNTQ